MTVRTKTFELKENDTRQIKIIDISAPIRVRSESGTFTCQEKINGLNITAGSTSVANGTDVVITPTDNCWGSELLITCTNAAGGIIHIAYMG